MPHHPERSSAQYEPATGVVFHAQFGNSHTNATLPHARSQQPQVFAYNNSGSCPGSDRGTRDRHSIPRPGERRICTPAGMTGTAFLRSDELPGDAAIGYLHPDD